MAIPSTVSTALAPPPRPQIFAVMRNGHEVIRGCMSDIEAALDAGDMKTAQDLLCKLERWGDLHMKMEEGLENKSGSGSGNTKSPMGLFCLLVEKLKGDDKTPSPTSNGSKSNNTNKDMAAQIEELRNHHVSLYEYEEDIRDAFAGAANVSEAVRGSFDMFRRENLEHLLVEEQIMMPAIMALTKQGHPMKQYMQQEIFPLLYENDGKEKDTTVSSSSSSSNVEFFIKFANQILARHEYDATTGQTMPRVRVFNHALWAIASSSVEWQQWNAWIRDVLPAEKHQETIDAIATWKEYQKNKKEEKAAPTAANTIAPSIKPLSAPEQAPLAASECASVASFSSTRTGSTGGASGRNNTKGGVFKKLFGRSTKSGDSVVSSKT